MPDTYLIIAIPLSTKTNQTVCMYRRGGIVISGTTIQLARINSGKIVCIQECITMEPSFTGNCKKTCTEQPTFKFVRKIKFFEVEHLKISVKQGKHVACFADSGATIMPLHTTVWDEVKLARRAN